MQNGEAARFAPTGLRSVGSSVQAKPRFSEEERTRPVGFDVQTLLALMMATVFATAIAIPFVIGWKVSAPARNVVASSLTQAMAWGSFLLARPLHDRLFSTIWIGLLGVSFVFVWHALRGWLGPRPGRTVLLGVAVLGPLGYGLGFDDYAFRVAWSNFGLSILMALVCLACAWPAPHASRGWRGLIIVCLGPLALVTLARGVLGGFFTEFYPALRTPHPINVVGAVLNHIALNFMTLALLVGWRDEAEQKLRLQADTDGLTGLLNRRAWLERAEDALAVARRYGEPIAVLMVDIDRFKQINDAGGHAAGDSALKLVGAKVQACLRRGDLACRYGGEEFCVLLRHAGAKAAGAFDSRLRSALLGSPSSVQIEFSSGLATFSHSDHNLESLISRADKALYQAKAEGRGRLVEEGSSQAQRTDSQPPST
jgi:diguanylate cyclase (GGDEF)-like protein